MPFPLPTKSPHTAPPEVALPHHAEDLDDMARRLEASGNYRMLRRLVPRPLSPPPIDQSWKIGAVLHTRWRQAAVRGRDGGGGSPMLTADLQRIIVPRPAIEHLAQLARTIVADIAKTRGGDQRWFPPLEDHELAIAEALWRGGSVRRLRAIVERILAYREANPRN